jgi:hypothetical protein
VKEAQKLLLLLLLLLRCTATTQQCYTHMRWHGKAIDGQLKVLPQ